MPNPIRETRVLKLVFITIPCLKFWALQYGNSTDLGIKTFEFVTKTQFLWVQAYLSSKSVLNLKFASVICLVYY